MTGTPAVDNFCVVTRDMIRRDALHNPQSVLAELHMQLSNLFNHRMVCYRLIRVLH